MTTLVYFKVPFPTGWYLSGSLDRKCNHYCALTPKEPENQVTVDPTTLGFKPVTDNNNQLILLTTNNVTELSEIFSKIKEEFGTVIEEINFISESDCREEFEKMIKEHDSKLLPTSHVPYFDSDSE